MTKGGRIQSVGQCSYVVGGTTVGGYHADNLMRDTHGFLSDMFVAELEFIEI